jgi:putative sporulation protein YtxC
MLWPGCLSFASILEVGRHILARRQGVVGPMELAAIATTSHGDELTGFISAHFEEFGSAVRVTATNTANLSVVDVCSDDTELVRNADLLTRLAQAVAMCIVNTFEEDILARMLQHRYGAVEVVARRSVLARAAHHLAAGGYPPEVERSVRAALIVPVLTEHLRADGAVMLDGVITFRLPEYLAVLEEALGQAVDDHLLEREYVEFIRLLRCFVAAQPPRTDRVHLVVRGANVRLLDRDGQPMPLESQPPVALESLEAAVNYEDVLISALIAAAPTRIVVHRGQGGASHHVDSVRRVFEARVERCERSSCGLCAGA